MPRTALASLLLIPLLAGCLSQVGQDEAVGSTQEGLSAAARRDRAGDIRDAAAARGMSQGWLLAGIADAETNLSHCWSELTWSCQGPTSPDCGGGPVVAGAGDGPCSSRQGGLGMFQFDAGNYEDTLAREGSRILSISGNTDAAVDFVTDMVIRSTFISGVSNATEAVAWMNGVRVDNSRLDAWINTVTRYYNGCPMSGSCWSERVGRYRRYATNVHGEMGATFWDTAGTGGGSDPGGGTDPSDGGTTPTLGAELMTQSFPRAGAPFTLAPGEERYGYFEFRNTGSDTWTPGFTFLGTVEPRDGDSALYGPDWTAPHRAASVESPVAPGGIGRFGLTVRAPTTPGDYRQAFNLVEEGVGFFADVGSAPRDGDIAVVLTVTAGGVTEPGDPGMEDPYVEPPPGRPPIEGDASADPRVGSGVSSGCSATGHPETALGPALLLLLGLRSRRRRL